MRVISAPIILRLNAAGILLLPILLAFQTLVIESTYRSRAHAWRVMLAVWIISEVVLWVPAAGILKAKRWSLRILAFLFVIWLLTLIFWVQWSILSVGILAFIWFFLNSTASEYKKSYLHSGKKWFSGKPDSIPNLKARIEGQSLDYLVARIDRDGVFLFAQEKNPPRLDEDSVIRLNLLYQDKTAVAKASWISFDPETHGLGLKFVKHSTDESKDLMDFIELLKGKGYIY